MAKISFKVRKKNAGGEKDYIKTVERLIIILSRLDKGASLSTAELAEKLGVTQRTIQRDLDLLCRSGYPITQEERGRHRFMEGFSLKKVELSEQQASLLSFMFDISHTLGSKFEDSFRGLFKRVLARDMDTPFYAKIPTGTKIPCDARIVRDLEDAIHDCERVRMSYQPDGKDAKDYLLEPFKIAFYDGFWYLIANDVVRKRILKLRVERIKKVEHTSEAFVPPANLMTLLDQSVNVWFEEKRGEKVLIRVAPEAAKYFQQRIYLPLQKIVKEETDGALILETYPGHPEEISHIIMNWIPCLTVIEPKEFKTKVRSAVEQYLKIC